jgi:hypothetical protein
MSKPAAGGVRVAWDDIPAALQAAIEEVCGASVAEAMTKPGGFSPGVAARVRCADGARWFVKAVSAEANRHSPRRERLFTGRRRQPARSRQHGCGMAA